MLEPEVLEELEKTLDEIKEKSAEGAAIVVEGRKDEKSLRKLGVSGPIHHIPTGGRTPLNSLEDLSDYEEAIVLTDFDEAGEDLADFCEKHLEKLDVTILFDLRSKLKHNIRKAVKDIEGMARFIRSERATQAKDNPKFDRNFRNRK